MLREITAGIATLIGTRHEVFLLTGSGSGALEAAVVNTLSPDDRVLAVVSGAAHLGTGTAAQIVTIFLATGLAVLVLGRRDPAA